MLSINQELWMRLCLLPLRPMQRSKLYLLSGGKAALGLGYACIIPPDCDILGSSSLVAPLWDRGDGGSIDFPLPGHGIKSVSDALSP